MAIVVASTITVPIFPFLYPTPHTRITLQYIHFTQYIDTGQFCASTTEVTCQEDTNTYASTEKKQEQTNMH